LSDTHDPLLVAAGFSCPTRRRRRVGIFNIQEQKGAAVARGNKSVGQLYLERIERQSKEAAASRKPVELAMLPDERAAIEQQIGRKLTNREIIQGGIQREDTRTFAQALEDSKWKPVMPKQDEGDIFDDAIREAEKAVRDRMLREMKSDERTLFLLKEDQLKHQQSKATAAEHEARLADPAVASKLAELRAMQAKAAYDPSWTVSDTLAIGRAIMQLETPGADLDAGFQLHQAALGIAAVKRQAVIEQLRSQRKDLEAKIAELDETVAAEGGEPSSEAAAPKADKPVWQVSPELYARAKAANPHLFE
jgi:hypothetical protein